MVYDMIGKQACMGDHKVPYISITDSNQFNKYLLKLLVPVLQLICSGTPPKEIYQRHYFLTSKML